MLHFLLEAERAQRSLAEMVKGIDDEALIETSVSRWLGALPDEELAKLTNADVDRFVEGLQR